MVVTGNMRAAGIVCLDARLKPIVARTRRLRACSSVEDRIATVVSELEREIESLAPATIVIERNAHPRAEDISRGIAAAVCARADAAGIRVVSVSLGDAAIRILGRASLQDAVRVVLERYAPLRRRLAPDGRSRLRDPDRWREARPLAGAFCLAFAVALELVTSIAGQTGPPPSSIC